MKTNKKELLDSFKGGLIVSCQVQHDDPTFSVDFVVKMAKAAQWGGAVGIRANDPEQIKAIKKEVDLPVIGLWKIWHDDTDVFITPTLEAAKAVWEAGAEIIALDCTSQITHEGRPAYELLPILKKEIPEAIIFADVSNYEEAVRAVEMGADIGTILGSFLIRHRSLILRMFTKFNILIIIRTITILQFIRGVSCLNQRISRLGSNTVINFLTRSLSSSKNSTLKFSLNLLLSKSTLGLEIG